MLKADKVFIDSPFAPIIYFAKLMQGWFRLSPDAESERSENPSWRSR